MTSEMRRIAWGIAKRYGMHVHSLYLLASACGPYGWRGCVPITHDYKPKYSKVGTRPLPDRPKRQKSLDYQLDEDEFDFL